MAKPTFNDFLRAMHAQVNVPEAAKDDLASYDIGYAMGKLAAHYKRKMTEEGTEEFDRGMMDGYTIGGMRRLQ